MLCCFLWGIQGEGGRRASCKKDVMQLNCRNCLLSYSVKPAKLSGMGTLFKSQKYAKSSCNGHQCESTQANMIKEPRQWLPMTFSWV